MNDKHIEYLSKLGLNKVEHAKGDFLNHLKGTAELLSDWGASKSLVLAGLYHSIYGTKDFERKSVSLDKRAEIQHLIGTESEELVYLFCVCDRRSFFSHLSSLKRNKITTFIIFDTIKKKTIVISRDILINLLELEVANLLDQAPESESFSDDRYSSVKGLSLSLKGIISEAASNALDEYLAKGMTRVS